MSGWRVLALRSTLPCTVSGLAETLIAYTQRAVLRSTVLVPYWVNTGYRGSYNGQCLLCARVWQVRIVSSPRSRIQHTGQRQAGQADTDSLFQRALSRFALCARELDRTCENCKVKRYRLPVLYCRQAPPARPRQSPGTRVHRIVLDNPYSLQIVLELARLRDAHRALCRGTAGAGPEEPQPGDSRTGSLYFTVLASTV